MLSHLILEITPQRRHHHYFTYEKWRLGEGKWFIVAHSGKRGVDRTSAKGCTGGCLMGYCVDGFLDMGLQQLSSWTSNSGAQHSHADC